MVQEGVQAIDLRPNAQRAPLRVPFVDLQRQSRDLRAELEAAFVSVLDRAAYTMGPELSAFEGEFADLCGCEYAVGVSSGTDAVKLALLGAGVEPGDEVIVPVNTFIATAEAVIHAGGVPVFTDVDIDTWCMTADAARPHLTWDTKAIVAVDLFGNPAPYNDLYRLGLPVIEDACQAAGATYMTKMCGAFGNAAAFSFYPSKTLAACGDGGAVTTDDDEIARRVRLLRHHGSADGTVHHEVGGTHRLDELQAAALRLRLHDLDATVQDQRREAWQLREAGHRLQIETAGGESSWHRHVTCELGATGRRYYDPPLHLQPSMRPYWRCPLPVAERFARRNVCLSS